MRQTTSRPEDGHQPIESSANPTTHPSAHRLDETANRDETPPNPPGTITTGTTTVGAVGTDGVVLAADQRASLGGQFVTNRSARKIEPVADRIAVAFSGSVSDAQSFVRQLRGDLRLYELRHDRPPSIETAATVAGELVRTGPYRVLDLVLGGVDDEPAVYQIGRGGGVMSAAYAASGSGMQLAYGVLEDAYEPDARTSACRHTVATAVAAATNRDTASGDGMTIATITETGLEIDRFDEPREAVTATAPETEVA